jgi:hypothetical protein
MAGIVNCGVCRAENGMIEGILGFGAELKIHSFTHAAQRELLRNRHVSIKGPREKFEARVEISKLSHQSDDRGLHVH